jgi:hypothetical protein
MTRLGSYDTRYRFPRFILGQQFTRACGGAILKDRGVKFSYQSLDNNLSSGEDTAEHSSM